MQPAGVCFVFTGVQCWHFSIRRSYRVFAFLFLMINTTWIERQEQLDQLGFEVIPVPFWGVAPFGGGLHCATADVYREGTMQDYFPKQIPGY